MTDPLTEVVTLLQPRARYSKIVHCAGDWRVRRSETGQTFYCVVLQGSCCIEVAGQDTIVLQQNDFVMIPAAYDYSVFSLGLACDDPLESMPTALANGDFRVGSADLPADVVNLIGHCECDSSDAALLVSLLPQLIHVRGEQRLTTLVQLVGDESRERRPAREVILERLLEVLFIEALRSTGDPTQSPGLLRGLADERLAAALRQMHASPTHPWTIAQLAREAALSRSAFFERFNRALGIPPMAYLLAWRMALAKNLFRRHEGGVAEVAQRVGYSSASAFSVAFTRYVGVAPGRYARGAFT